MKNAKCRVRNNYLKNNKKALLHMIRILFLFIPICTFITLTCASFTKKNTYVEPVNVVILDNSRVENHKIRHIFRQYLIKEVIEGGSEWLIIIHTDSLSDDYVHTKNITYTIHYDIMDFSVYDIESESYKLLAGVKIIDCSNNTVVALFIDDKCGSNIDEMCDNVANTLAARAIKTLAIFREREPTMPDVLTEPQDSLKTEDQ